MEHFQQPIGILIIDSLEKVKYQLFLWARGRIIKRPHWLTGELGEQTVSNCGDETAMVPRSCRGHNCFTALHKRPCNESSTLMKPTELRALTGISADTQQQCNRFWRIPQNHCQTFLLLMLPATANYVDLGRGTRQGQTRNAVEMQIAAQSDSAIRL